MEKVIYKVYCGSNGKWYTFLNYQKAKDLFNSQYYSNKHTKLIEIRNNVETLIEENI